MNLSEQNRDLNDILNDLYMEYNILRGTEYFSSPNHYQKWVKLCRTLSVL